MNNNELKFKFEASNEKKYKTYSIWNSAIYTRKSIIKQLSGIYYQVL